MDEQQKLESRRERRHELLEIRRERVRKVECPECRADPLTRCRTPRGQARFQNHQERWDLALNLGVMKRSSR